MRHLALALLLAAPAAAQIDPCIAMNRACAGSACWWEWSYHQVRIRNAVYLEWVPTAYGIALMCMFQGGHRSEPLIDMVNLGTEGRPVGCNESLLMYRHAFWWLDVSPVQGDVLIHNGSGMFDLRARPIGLHWTPGSFPMAIPTDDLQVRSVGFQDWNRKPTYWAVLISPARGYW